MAVGLLGPLVQVVSGRVGSVIFIITPSGQVIIKAVPNVIRNSHSERQTIVRARLNEFNRAWRGLPDSNRSLWGTVAQANYRQGENAAGVFSLIKGSRRNITDKNAFFQANHLARDVGATVLVLAPQFNIPAPNVVVNLAAVSDGNMITLTWDVPPGATLDHFVRIWMKNQQKMCHRQLVTFAPVMDQMAVVTQLRGADGVRQPVNFFKNGKMYIQVDVVGRSTGWASSPSNTLLIDIPQ